MGPRIGLDSVASGAWRSLAAHSVWVRKVAGSNPAAPTLVGLKIAARARAGAYIPGMGSASNTSIEEPGVCRCGWSSSSASISSLELPCRIE